MFSPATRKPRRPSLKDLAPTAAAGGGPDSPSTPLPSGAASAVPNRPATGTPAPWASRLSVLARISSTNRTEKGKGADADPVQPVYVGEFPQIVRSAENDFLQKSAPVLITGHGVISGGIDKESSLSWIICGNQLFIWSCLSPSVSKNCIVLEIPSLVLENGNIKAKHRQTNSWLVCVVKWNSSFGNVEKLGQQCHSAGIVVCNQKNQSVAYWPDIYADSLSPPVSISVTEPKEASSPGVGKTTPSQTQQPTWTGSTRIVEGHIFNSLIAMTIPGSSNECVSIACCSNGELWLFRCHGSSIQRERVAQNVCSSSTLGNDDRHTFMNKGYARSLVWRSHPLTESSPQFFLLTDHEIQCWNLYLAPKISISKLWSHEIVGTDGDLGIKKDLAGQKHIWLLDMQVDERGKEFNILVATFCKDRISSSSYTQYSLLTMQYNSGSNMSSENVGSTNERILEKKAPMQVIIPKAKVEDEDILFSMRLRVGGKPPGSAIILSGDGTATVASFWRGSMRLYQFDLPWDAGKVLDASVFPSMEHGEEGSWIVLTEKAGIWAIPERAVLLGGVEPPERSLSRKGSSNGGTTDEEKRNLAFGGNVAPRRTSSEAWDAGVRRRDALATIAQRNANDEESEALLGRLFHDFLSSGKVDGAFEKLKNSGAFEKDGEINVFARTSKAIVDTLAKHWTTTRGAEIVAMAVVASQLLDKQQKHQRFLQFLALSKGHKELHSRQRHSLQTIMEHGEKIASMIQLRDLQNMLNQKRSSGCSSPYSNLTTESGSLWDLIQIVGNRARRNTVLLMDRDNAEVFYSKVSDLEEVFYCISHQLQYIIGEEQPITIQMERACELSNACTTIIRAAMHYKSTNVAWYPSPEGLSPWYSQPVVRSGLWSLASLMLKLLQDTSGFDFSAISDLFSHLEGLTDVVLEAYAGAITAKIERGEEHRGLVEEQCKRRDLLLEALYQQVKRLADARYEELGKGIDIDDMKEAPLRELYLPVLSIAKRNEGYQTLWNICCDLNDAELLRSLMHDSVGPKGGFSYFVFTQLYEKRQYGKLLRLGEEFPEELAIFLKQHKNLLWLHEIFLNHFSSASETLHALALSNDDGSSMVIDGDSNSKDTKERLSLAERKRLLNISRIAIAAGGDADFEARMKCIEADMQILSLQEEILNLLSDGDKERGTTLLLSPTELIDMCLKSKRRELSLIAFDVFAWTSSSFRRSNRSLLEECWKNAADQDDWAGLYQASLEGGWSDEETLQHLRETLLFQASNRCHSPDAPIYEGAFEEALPLRQEEMENPILKALGSVEGILMQHKDFPDAGKLMLTAIMLGTIGGANVEAEDGILME